MGISETGGPSPEKYRIGILGCGIGGHHLRAFLQLADRFEVVALCDIDRARAQALVDEHHLKALVTNDPEELFRIDTIDILDICTPSGLHYRQTLQALGAGKHVICEKPIAASLKEVDQLIATEAQSGRRVMPIFQYRFGHGAQKLKYLVEQGVAGKHYLTTVETHWRRRMDYYALPWHGRWETSLGGAAVSLGIHAQDVMQYILGPIRRVYARAATLVNPIETEDTLAATIELADSSLCALSITTGSSKQITRHRFCFSDLVAESSLQPYSNTSDPWSFVGDTPEVERKIAACLQGFIPRLEGFAGQFEGLYPALRQGIPLPVSLLDARAAMELVTAIYYSARTNQPVDLPLGQDHPYYTGFRPDQPVHASGERGTHD